MRRLSEIPSSNRRDALFTMYRLAMCAVYEDDRLRLTQNDLDETYKEGTPDLSTFLGGPRVARDRKPEGYVTRELRKFAQTTTIFVTPKKS